MIRARTERPLVKLETNGELDQKMKAAALGHGGNIGVEICKRSMS